MLKFTVVIALLLTFVDFQTEGRATTLNEEKDLLLMIPEAKNRAFDGMQRIRMLTIADANKFIANISNMVEKFWNDMDMLKKESGNKNNLACDKLKADIVDIALVTISDYESCLLKVVRSADTDLRSVVYDGSSLTKEIQHSNKFDDISGNMIRKIVNLKARSFEFDQYLMKLENCKNEQNLLQLNERSSQILANYKLCLPKK